MIGFALKMALHDRVRFAITILGVAFAVTLVLVQVGLFLGILDNATVTIEKTKADLWVTSRNTPNVDFPHPFPDSYVQRIRGVGGVAAADNLIVTYVPIALPNGAEETLLAYGIANGERWGLPWTVAEGDLESLRGGRTMLLDDSAARRFGTFAVGEYREIAGTRLQVVGRTQGAKSFTTVPIAFFDSHLLQTLVPSMLDSRTTYALVRVADGVDVGVVQAELRRRLPYNDVYTRREWAERTRHYWLVNTGLGMNMYVTGLLGCLVGLIVVAQTLYAATMEHLREFGTLKAVGGSDADVYAILGWQAAIAAVVGFVVGLIPSFAARALLGRAADLDVRITGAFLALVFAGALAMCLFASALSFRKIASIDPALVFRA